MISETPTTIIKTLFFYFILDSKISQCKMNRKGGPVFSRLLTISTRVVVFCSIRESSYSCNLV